MATNGSQTGPRATSVSKDKGGLNFQGAAAMAQRVYAVTSSVGQMVASGRLDAYQADSCRGQIKFVHDVMSGQLHAGVSALPLMQLVSIALDDLERVLAEKGKSPRSFQSKLRDHARRVQSTVVRLSKQGLLAPAAERTARDALSGALKIAAHRSKHVNAMQTVRTVELMLAKAEQLGKEQKARRAFGGAAGALRA